MSERPDLEYLQEAFGRRSSRCRDPGVVQDLLTYAFSLEKQLVGAMEYLETAKYRIEGDNPLWHSKACKCCIARRALNFALAALAPGAGGGEEG